MDPVQTTSGSTVPPQSSPDGSFAEELRVRAAEAQAVLQAAEALDELEQAQIAESDLADLRAMAARNDVALDLDPALPTEAPQPA